MSDQRDNSTMMGFLIGAAVGAGVALLMAPAAGEDTRRRLGESARRIRHTANNRLHDLKDTISERGKDAMSAGREAFDREMDQGTRENV